VASSQAKNKKPRKKRFLTPDQQEAAAKRLEAAREKRLRDNPPAYKSVHPDVLALTPDDHLNVNSVKLWIKHQQDLFKEHKQDYKKGEKGAYGAMISTDTYIKNMQAYLRTGVWLDNTWGKKRENKVMAVCEHVAYYHEGKNKGFIKRSQNTYYKDLGRVYKSDMGII
jgi:hypothetical protein